MSAKDLDVMYEKAKTSGEIFLWVQNCEDTDDESDSVEPCRKKGKYQSKEDKLDEIYRKLKSQHDGTVYTMPQLRLWAKMIQCGTHDDFKEPPNVPMITGMSQKRTKRDSLAETFCWSCRSHCQSIFTSSCNSECET